MTKFNEYPFKPFLLEAVEKLGFTEPTKIQQEMMPHILKGTSAIGQSHTGTGKTHSFIIPIVERIDVSKQEVQAVISAPTRELAMQIFNELQKLVIGSGIEVKSFIGGTDKQRSINKLKTQPHIVVGTPGRLRDLVKENALLVHTGKILVIDEADLAFDLGFIEEIDQVAGKMKEDLEMYVFSATIPEKLKPFLKKYMESPVHVKIGDKRPTAEGLDFYLVPVRSKKKMERLQDVMKVINPYLAIIFVNTRTNADYVADQLAKEGIRVGRVHGDLAPRERVKMMRQIRDLEYQYIVATDLAARGIDIQGVSHVINYELPEDLEFFIHRVGRTARAGMKGLAITLFKPEEDDAIVRIEKMGIPFQQKDIVKGEFVDLKERHSRTTRIKKTDAADAKAKTMVHKPKKVRPMYKKKMKWKMDEIKKMERRKNRKK
ncbi:DEAD/DEAH box helicase [Planococcus kocurii]|uniref:DEAD-box ATP-dependent RNA helicase CshB n=2 Tax=Planococcus TaxID=1372 RepID=A0ABM5WX10_9BACL|nr:MULTISPECIES: DEAD/DEAH box helicase [Planococcus]ALS78885.1 DEAD/DEAH box helicase [Planococcus kocurii]AQU79158.1 DEAD/DEAH box helicase [Planococcus faecalis]KAA0957751.1 DEAD/DEAH box helicase [Planococcus sp. ANT_H30]